MICKEVHPGLWIGAYPQDVSDIKAAGFELHIDCRGENPPHKGTKTEIQTFYLGLWDEPSMPMTEDVRARVKVAGKKIAAAVRMGKKTLVTCTESLNRSSLVAGHALHELTGKRVAAKDITNPQFVRHLESLTEKTYDADVLIYDVVGGAYTKASTSSSALGGSELEVVQIAHALADRGHKVAVANQIKDAVNIDGVQYLPYAECVGQRVKTLYVQRHSPVPVPAVEYDRLVIRTTDMNEGAYKGHVEILSSGEAELLCVSKWQAGLFPHAKRRCIVPSPLGDMPKVAKVPGRFVFASSPAKGLEPTLGAWTRLKAAHPEEMASAKLLVTAPNYKFGRPLELTQELRDAGVEHVPATSLEHYRELIASAEGVFYANAYPETACMIAAMCERSHTRFHCWPMADKGGIPEMLTNPRLLAKSQDDLDRDFLAALREPDRSDWYATGKLKDLSVDAVLPIWEHALHLTDNSAHEDKVPLYIAADKFAGTSFTMPVPFVATPAYGGMMTMPYVSSVIGLMCGLQKLGADPTIHFIGNESLITRARNNCVADFLKSNCTHLVFVDADIGFSAQHLLDMVNSGLDVVFGAYPKKSINWNNVLKAAAEGVAKTPQDLEQYMADYAINFHDDSLKTGNFKVLERNGMAFMSVKEASTGFCSISRAAIEKMIAEYGSELEYTCDSNMGYGEKRYALFDCPIVAEGESDAPLIRLRKAAKKWNADKQSPQLGDIADAQAELNASADAFSESLKKTATRYLSEDYGFSRRWASLGGEVFVYVGAQLTHTGTHTFHGSFRKMFGCEIDEEATTHIAA